MALTNGAVNYKKNSLKIFNQCRLHLLEVTAGIYWYGL